MTTDSRLTTETSHGVSARVPPTVPRTLAITGGKGGVGKTQVALNLALVLADQGQRTLLLDGDTELANVNVMLGQYPSVTLEHVVLGECALREALLSVTERLDLLPGASGVPGILEQSDTRQSRFLDELSALEAEYDVVVIDTAAGLRRPALHMVAASHVACVVITPDPTSLTDAFSLLKVLHRKGYRRTPSVIVNMARGATDAQAVYRRFSGAVARYIGLQTHYLGAIWRDETIAQSVTSQRPVAMMPSSDPSCRQFWSLADMVSVRWSQGVAPANGFAGYWRRLLERQGVPQSDPPEPQQAAVSTAPTMPDSAPPWLGWTRDPSVDVMERYRRLTALFQALGEAPDEALAETLGCALHAVNWSAADDSVRRLAASQLREVARFIDPPQGTPPEQARALGARPVRYDDRRYGSQERLISRLQSSAEDRPLDGLLQSLSREDQARD